MKNRVTKKELRRQAFKEAVYQTLRDFQQDKIPNTQVCAGRLSDKLTVVFDRIVDASKELERA